MYETINATMYYSGYSRRNTVCEILGMEIGKQAVNIFYVEFFPLLILKHFFYLMYFPL